MNNSKESEEKLEVMRHSLAHILAMAVLRLFPQAKLGIGPAIEKGFYYEFQNDPQFVQKDLEAIDKEMHNIVNENLEFKQILVNREEAMDIIHQAGQIFKTELLKQVPDDQISFFKTGDFLDLCRGPHLKSTREIGAFKLIKIEDSYWLNQEYRPKLQKIIGIAFQTEEELNKYLNEIHQLKFRSSQIIGKNLNFLQYDKHFSDKNNILLEKGVLVKNQVKNFLSTTLINNDYSFVETPTIAKYSFFHEYLKEKETKDTYLNPIKIGQEDYLIRASCTPAHNLIFHNKKYSYKQLPLKLSEFAICFMNNDIHVQRNSLESHKYCSSDQILT